MTEVLDEREPHPLFPPADDEDDSMPPLVSEIHVRRVEGGKLMTSPRVWRQEELMSLGQLAEEYGGGEYELIARHNHRISARRKYNIPGPQKPMYDTSKEVRTESREPRPQTVAAVPSDPMQALMGGQGGILGLIMMMMQQMMAAQAQASAQQSQMMIAMMNQGSERSKESLQMMLTTFQAQSESQQRDKQAQLELMKELAAARSSGGGSDDAFFKGVEFMRHFSTQQMEGMKAAMKEASGEFDWEGLIETGLQALQGFSAFKGMMPDAAAPAVVAQ